MVLSKVKQYIEDNLNPKKRNILNPMKENFEQVPSINEILSKLCLTEDEYCKCLSVSSDSDFQIHLKQNPNACFVNDYFIECLQSWKANIDIQPVFNHYKTVKYMCAFFSKTEDGTSEEMK